MKRFLMYLIVVVVCLFVGFTTYYAVQNKESFSLVDIKAGGYVCINKNDTMNLPLLHTKPYKTTEITVQSSNENVASYNKDTKIITGLEGGISSFTIKTTNKNYGPYVFDVYVGDGTKENPYYISNATQFASVIKSNTNEYYKLINDIDLRLYNKGNWKPVEAFQGQLNGDNHTISNLQVTGTKVNAGLFGQVLEGAKIENLKLSEVTLDGEFDNAGAVAGLNKGFIGKCQVNKIDIKNSKKGANNGGLVGINDYAERIKSVVSMCETNDVNFNISSESLNGGLVGKVVASSIINSSAIVNNFNATNILAVYGGVVGKMQDVISPERVFIVKNNLAITNQFNKNAKVGGIAGKCEKNSVKNVIENNYYTNSTLKGLNGEDNTAKDYKYLSPFDLKDTTKYTGFNFEDVWTLAENSNYAKVNFEGIYQIISVYEQGKNITSKEEFNSAIMDLNNSDSVEFNITCKEIDLQNEVWNPINQFSGKLYSEQGTTIKNFKINDTESQLVGFIRNNIGEIENITFENVEIISTNPNFDTDKILANVGVIAGVNSGLIKNCKVLNASVVAYGASLGGIAGQNNSIIETTTFKGDLLAKGDNTLIGGITGNNSEVVKDCITDVSNIKYENNDVSNSYISIGGIAGINNKKIIDGISKVNIESTGLSKFYIGGIAGKNNINSIITHSYFDKAGNISVNESNAESFVGGIAGMNASQGLVETSGNDSIIKGANVGGIVCNNYGTVKESYAGKGILSGKNVGGLVCTNFASDDKENPNLVINCYTTQSLKGLTDDSVVSGMVSKLQYTSKIQNCFSAANFVGLGEAYAESASEFRKGLNEGFLDYGFAQINNLLKKLNKREKIGEYNNSIITNYKKAKIQYKYSYGKSTGKTFAEVTDDEFMNDKFKEIFVNNGFQTSIWKGIGQNGDFKPDAVVSDYYPTLINAYYPKVEE